jgi:hypothetical protein
MVIFSYQPSSAVTRFGPEQLGVAAFITHGSMLSNYRSFIAHAPGI